VSAVTVPQGAKRKFNLVHTFFLLGRIKFVEHLPLFARPPWRKWRLDIGRVPSNEYRPELS
jgi:hypothetical protein